MRCRGVGFGGLGALGLWGLVVEGLRGLQFRI